MVERARMVGHLNNIILEIVNYGQEVRNKVERRLRNDRLKEEQIMKVMLAEIARDERLEEKAKKRAAWLDNFYKMEAAEMTAKMGMLTVVDWEESMEVDRPIRDVTLDMDGDTIMS